MAGRDFEIREVEAREGGDGGVRVHVHVPRDLKFFEGHFPGSPVVPGVAQLVLVERAIRTAYPELGRPRGLSRLKFTARIDPGDDIVVELVRSDGKVRFTIARSETECSRGTLAYA